MLATILSAIRQPKLTPTQPLSKRWQHVTIRLPIDDITYRRMFCVVVAVGMYNKAEPDLIDLPGCVVHANIFRRQMERLGFCVDDSLQDEEATKFVGGCFICFFFGYVCFVMFCFAFVLF